MLLEVEPFSFIRLSSLQGQDGTKYKELLLAEDKQFTIVIQSTTVCHDSEHNGMLPFRTQQYAVIQNTMVHGDPEQNGML
jgi:hypothetical protein